jgi:hypothetical protein
VLAHENNQKTSGCPGEGIFFVATTINPIIPGLDLERIVGGFGPGPHTVAHRPDRRCCGLAGQGIFFLPRCLLLLPRCCALLPLPLLRPALLLPSPFSSYCCRCVIRIYGIGSYVQ